jgi:hypothetical protein
LVTRAIRATQAIQDVLDRLETLQIQVLLEQQALLGRQVSPVLAVLPQIREQRVLPALLAPLVFRVNKDLLAQLAIRVLLVAQVQQERQGLPV